MKILYILTNLNRSAPNTVIVNIIKTMNNEDVFVLSLNESYDDNYKKLLEQKGIKYIEYQSFKKAFLNIKKILTQMKDIDILHLNGYHPNIYGYCLQKLNNKYKLISTCHSVENKEAESHQFKGISYFKTRLRLFLQSFLYSRQDKTIGVSKQVESYLKEIDCKNSTTIYNGVDYGDFPKLKSKKLNKDCLDLCQVGHVMNRKNQIFSIDLISNLKTRGLNIRLHIFGSYDEYSEYYKYLQKKIIDNNMENNIIFYGSLQFCQLFKKLQDMDIQLLPSLSEGLPLALLEAFYFELPAIVSSNGGMQEVVEDYKNGLVVNINDTREFERIYKYIESKKYIENRIQTRKMALEHFSSQKMAKKYLREYLKI